MHGRRERVVTKPLWPLYGNPYLTSQYPIPYRFSLCSAIASRTRTSQARVVWYQISTGILRFGRSIARNRVIPLLISEH